MADSLKIEDLILGSGGVADSGDLLVVDYIGKLDDGTIFDQSIDRLQPFFFRLGAGRVIQGWEVGLQGMKVGGVRELTIPAALGYGGVARPGIPANSTLHFEVRLFDAEAINESAILGIDESALAASFRSVFGSRGAGSRDDIIDVSSLPGNSRIRALDGSDRIKGGNLSDIIQAGEGNDTVSGGGGSDLIIGGPDNDVIDGGSGTTDIAAYAGKFGDYAISFPGLDSQGYLPLRIADTVGGRDGVDLLDNIEAYVFSDRTLSFANIQAIALDNPLSPLRLNGDTAGLLYVIYYGRPADPGGLSFWLDKVRSSGFTYAPRLGDGLSSTEAPLYGRIVNDFGRGPEYEQLFVGKSNTEKVDAIYRYCFGRNSEIDPITGENYWEGKIRRIEISLAQMAVEVALGAQGADLSFLRNRIDSSATFLQALDTPQELVAFAGPTAGALASQWLQGFGPTAATSVQADALVTQILALA
jgi:hypothetical protein